MKKIIVLLLASLVTMSAYCIDYSLHMYDGRVYRVALGSGTAPSADDMKTIGIRPGDMVVNTDDDALYIMSTSNVYTKITAAGSVTVAAFAPSSLTVSGRATIGGELEVNNSDVDINMSQRTNSVAITQTNATGTAEMPLMQIDDERTGSTANSVTEATLRINAKGTYGIAVTNSLIFGKGIVSDAGQGLDVKDAGALKIGAATATTVDYGSASVSAHTFTTTSGGDASMVFPLLSIGNGEINDMSATKLTAGTVASAIGGQNITNIPASGLSDTNLKKLALNDISSGTNIAVGGIILASGKLISGSAGGVGAAVTVHGDGSLDNTGDLAITNANLAKVKTNDGSSLTNIPASGLSDVDLVKLAGNNGSSLTNLVPAGMTGGFTGVITNACVGFTNLLNYLNGICTNVVAP